MIRQMIRAATKPAKQIKPRRRAPLAQFNVWTGDPQLNHAFRKACVDLNLNQTELVRQMMKAVIKQSKGGK